jgi:ribosomal protein S18 acetylase RimI-like enzyme
MALLIILLLLTVLALLLIGYSVLTFRRRWPLRMARFLCDLPPVVMPDGYRLRVLHPGDAEDWVRIMAAAFAAEKCDSLLMNRSALGRMLSLMLRLRRGTVLLAEREMDRELVGTATALEEGIREGRSGLVVCLAVHPEHQRRGLGAALLTAALHTLHERGHSRAFLHTNPALVTAIRLYERLGFAPVDRRGEARTTREATPCG